MNRTASILLLATLALPPYLQAARQPGDPLQPGFNSFSRQQDIQLGREAAQQVKQKSQVVQNAILQNYVKRIGERLADAPEAVKSEFPFSFTVINDPSVNAFALPGGPMFINTGLLKDVDNEAQLAGVMAHEMSHVILRHGTNQASKARWVQVPAMLASIFTGRSMLGSLVNAGIGFGANSVLLKFSRDDESEADALGSHLMAHAGYDPVQMARFFQKLNQESQSGLPQFLSDHPNPGNREQAILAEVRTIPRRPYGFGTGDFRQMKQELARLPAVRSGEDRFRGLNAPPSDVPSTEMRELRGQSFSLQYPANWQAFGGDSSDSVTLAPRSGIVQMENQQAGVGLGATVSYYFPENGRGRSLNDATDDLVHHLIAENNRMEVTGNGRRLRVDGRDGIITSLESGSPYGGTETDTLLTVETPRGLFYMVFIAPSRQSGQLQDTFDRMVGSIRFK